MEIKEETQRSIKIKNKKSPNPVRTEEKNREVASALNTWVTNNMLGNS